MTTEIHNMDCRVAMSLLMEPASVHCCVTSPPYFGLRDYGHAEQLGLEQTPDQYIAAMVDVFREVRRVLRDDGTLWLNIGDSYTTGGSTAPRKSDPKVAGDVQRGMRRVGTPDGLKPKDLIGIPWMLAFALRTDGWYLRQEIIWHKPNPMPESVTDRCTKAHEHIFLLAKSPRYYFDAEAIKEPASSNPISAARRNRADFGSIGHSALNGDGQFGQSGKGLNESARGETRNRRDVWTVTTKPYKGAHFATFPPDLIEPCVLAGCPVGGMVLDPFGGSGTTALVAQRTGRNAVLCELNPDYVVLAQERLARG